MKPKKFNYVFLPILFILLSVSSQNLAQNASKQEAKKYEKAWSKVDSLEKGGLFRSALKVVDDIHRKASAAKDHPQVVKALIHRMKYRSNFTEDDLVNSLNELEAATGTTAFPLKHVLHSVLAESYWKFYQNNRWRFFNRSQVASFEPKDIRTWDLARINRRVAWHYEQSLKPAGRLQEIPITDFDEIILPGSARELRQSLYDFLAHRAFVFFAHGEAGLHQPADEFELAGDQYFSGAKTFAGLPIHSTDTSSLSLKAAKLLQQMIAFHLEDKDPSSLVDVDLKRLDYVHNYSTEINRDSLYYRALTELSNTLPDHPASAEVSHALAKWHYQKGAAYQPGLSDDYKTDYNKAYRICKAAMAKYPDSYGASLCQQLQGRITSKSISWSKEMVHTPGQPALLSLTYRNLAEIWLRIIEIDPDVYIKQRNSRKYVEGYIDKAPLKEWSVKLPDEKDFHNHRTEIRLPALPGGQYLILVSTAADFRQENNNVSFMHYQVSNIAHMYKRLASGGQELFVMDRTTGQPLPDVRATVYRTSKDDKKDKDLKLPEFSSDEKGYIKIPPMPGYRYLWITLQKDKDLLITTGALHIDKSRSTPKKYTQTHFFTDRAIYRPGQTLYFKGIVIEKEGDHKAIVSGINTKITLFDVNRQAVSTLDLKTNEFGTFSGSFVLPDKGLTGRMQLKNESGQTYIQVEEYKRPKFEVKFMPVEGQLMANQQVMITGEAKSYAGTALDGATVSYRITREAYLPYWWRYGRHHSPSGSTEIMSGKTQVDKQGAFTIEFTAIPDRKISPKLQPQFIYTIHADVTDISGEMQSQTSRLKVGYKALFLETDLGESIDKTGKPSFKVNTTNSSGQPVKASGTVRIWQLKQPNQLLRQQLWDPPDVFTMTRDEFKAEFPRDIYGRENDPTTWETTALVMEKAFDTGKENSVNIDDLGNWNTGMYRMEISTNDTYQNQVALTKEFLVFGQHEQHIPLTSYLWVKGLTTTALPGDTAKFLLGSRAKAARILYEVSYKNDILHREWIDLNDEQRLLQIPVKEEHQGNLQVLFTMAMDNRQHIFNRRVTVLYATKKLDLAFSTFRDKLLPGQEEEWRVTIKDHRGDVIAAELLAAMYDASLDVFKKNNWSLDLYSAVYRSHNWTYGIPRGAPLYQSYFNNWIRPQPIEKRTYDRLNWFGHRMRFGIGGAYAASGGAGGVSSTSARLLNAEVVMDGNGIIHDLNADVSYKANDPGHSTPPPVPPASGEKALDAVKTRSNFQETAFFFPDLMTNEEGEIVLKFTMPEALTRWKFMGLAHTKDLAYGRLEGETLTQKDLMVVPNPPRFFREGDEMVFPVKVSNLAEKEITGDIRITFYHALTMQAITDQLLEGSATKKFSIEPSSGEVVSWKIKIPSGYEAITYKVVARAGNFSDGEEMAIPVLTNRMLVTESMPLPVRGQEIRQFEFKKLTGYKPGEHPSLKHHRLTLEFTSNPAWYAVQALPYLMEFPHECSEQIFSRLYANTLASHIANSHPRIKAVFQAWKTQSPGSFLSKLEQNPELKQVLLSETPWVMEAQNESERKKRLGLLFDGNTMQREATVAITKLSKMQLSGGAWPWFNGMRENRYVTQHIITGLGQLDHLGVKRPEPTHRWKNMIESGLKYMDRKIKEDYEKLKLHDVDLNKNNLSRTHIQYFYARSFYQDMAVLPEAKKAHDYYKDQLAKYWPDQNYYLQGMIALAFHRSGQKDTPAAILKSLKENAIYHEELGMYWKGMLGGYYWYQAPIETQALLIEAFEEAGQDRESVEAMKVWLLKQKQTQDWKTTKATAAACYALLLRGTDLLSKAQPVTITVGEKTIDPAEMEDVQPEGGTGYFKTAWSKSEIHPEMGKVTVSKKDEGVAWGAVYWQYFEQLDKITPAETPLQIRKQLFKETLTDAGPVISPVTPETALQPGDKIKVRIELRIDRDLEYVHMKDMRASGLEPVNVLSGYRYQDGLGYYESTRDAATNFYFDRLPRGTYVFEYPLKVNLSGDFSNGITTVQCMYAPEFAAHSEGVRVKIGE